MKKTDTTERARCAACDGAKQIYRPKLPPATIHECPCCHKACASCAETKRKYEVDHAPTYVQCTSCNGQGILAPEANHPRGTPWPQCNACNGYGRVEQHTRNPEDFVWCEACQRTGWAEPTQAELQTIYSAQRAADEAERADIAQRLERAGLGKPAGW